MLALAVATTAHGQWSTNAWPAWEHSRSGLVWMTECSNALSERAMFGYARHLDYVPRMQMNLRNTKMDIKDMLEWGMEPSPLYWNYFVDRTAISNDVEAWAAANGTNLPPFLTVSSVCVYAGLPTNWFDYTPKRGQSGLGWLTNGADFASLGRQHGETNEYTAQGGAVFPTNRTEWYTTDYGWDGVKGVLAHMTMTLDTSKEAALQLGGSRWSGSGGSWNEAKAAVSSNALGSSYVGRWTEGTVATNESATNYTATANAGNAEFYIYFISDWPTNQTSDSRAFWLGISPVNTTSSVFNANGDTISTSQYSLAWRANIPTIWGSTYTQGVEQAIGEWCDEPTVDDSKAKGWMVFDGDDPPVRWSSYYVHDHAVTNGLKYR